MFTGVVEAVGKVKTFRRIGKGARLVLKAGSLAKGMRAGESLCVDGVCLTVSQKEKSILMFDLSSETLRVTTLGQLRQEEEVNLERPLKVGDRVRGHLVQGHVDGLGTIRKRQKEDKGLFLEINYPSFLNPYLIPRGSIAIQGVSLTVAKKSKNRLGLFLIPETLKRTTLGRKQVGASLNLEADLVAKLVRRHNR